MKTSTDLIIDAIEAITKAGGYPRPLMDMSLSEAIVTLHKNGLHLTLVDVNKKTAKVDDGWISNIGHSVGRHPDSLSPDDIIEAKCRGGHIFTGFARHYAINWRETDGDQYDIVAYRILKD